MSNGPEHSFDSLQKLLALKKHEQPPPGFFNNFSSKVVSRIEAEPAPSFWARLRDSFQLRPGLIWAGGGVLAVLLVSGIVAVNSANDSQNGSGQNLVLDVPARTNQPTNVQPSLFDRLKLDTQPAAYKDK